MLAKLHTLRHWLAVFLLAGALALPVTAQAPGAPAPPAPGATPASERTYPIEIFLALGIAAVILTVVCAPSRKKI